MSRLRAAIFSVACVLLVCLGYWVASREVQAMTTEVSRLGQEIKDMRDLTRPIPSTVRPR